MTKILWQGVVTGHVVPKARLPLPAGGGWRRRGMSLADEALRMSLEWKAELAKIKYNFAIWRYKVALIKAGLPLPKDD